MSQLRLQAMFHGRHERLVEPGPGVKRPPGRPPKLPRLEPAAAAEVRRDTQELLQNVREAIRACPVAEVAP